MWGDESPVQPADFTPKQLRGFLTWLQITRSRQSDARPWLDGKKPGNVRSPSVDGT
jgi:hypothetical protein